jgi:hypothetical protein
VAVADTLQVWIGAEPAAARRQCLASVLDALLRT